MNYFPNTRCVVSTEIIIFLMQDLIPHKTQQNCADQKKHEAPGAGRHAVKMSGSTPLGIRNDSSLNPKWEKTLLTWVWATMADVAMGHWLSRGMGHWLPKGDGVGHWCPRGMGHDG